MTMIGSGMSFAPIRKQFIDISGQRKGMLLVIRPLGSHNEQVYFLVRCECGNERPVAGNHLRSGRQKSCGCLKPQSYHGRGDHELYKIWRGMIRRCSNAKVREYKNYGGRGISVCRRWLNIDNFIADMGPRSSQKHTLDRINNNGNYNPNNCRWATWEEQQNNKRNNRRVHWDGREQTVQEWANEYGFKYSTLKQRLDRLPLEKAMTPKYMIKRRTIEWNGEVNDLAGWARKLRVSRKILYRRIVGQGWPPERAFTEPLRNWWPGKPKERQP